MMMMQVMKIFTQWMYNFTLNTQREESTAPVILNTGQVNFPLEFIIDRGKEPICHVSESLRNCEKSI